MNTSQKCNCCIKESVCKYKSEFEEEREVLEKARVNWKRCEVIEIAINCKEFMAKPMTRGQNG